MDELLKNVSKLSPEKRKLVELLLKEKNVNVAKNHILPQSRQGNSFPLSFAQQRMWFLDRLAPGNPMYNNPAAVSIKGRVNVGAIEKALAYMGRRHEVLRTVFDDNGGNPVQVIQEQAGLKLNKVDFSKFNEPEKQEKLRQESIAEAQRPFDLSAGPMLRTTLISMGQDEYVFLLTMHHIISDAWTLSLFIKEFAELYTSYSEGRDITLPDLPIQYVDFACWQRQYLQNDVLEDQLTYWAKELHGADKAMNLPIDHKRPPMQTFNGDVAYFKVSPAVTNLLTTLSKQQDVTLFMTTLAAINLLFYHYSGQDDVAVGTPIANRNRSEVEFLLGVFVNTLVMRNDLSGNPTFIELLQRVKEKALGAYAHQDIPFETLIEELKPERDMSRPPFFQVMFVMQNAPAQPLQLNDAALTPLELHTPTAKYDITIVLEPVDGGLDGQIIYNTDLFEKETIGRLLQHLDNALSLVGSQPEKRLSEFSFLTDAEKRTLLKEWGVAAGEPHETPAQISRLFEEQAAQNPEALILCGREKINYRSLNERANRMARLLLKKGVHAESIVGIYLERSIDLIVSMMAVFKAGGIMLPLDPDYPVDRIFYMLNDSGTERVIVTSKGAAQLSEAGVELLDLNKEASLDDQASENLAVPLSPENGAYVIYTSGSTGAPKGVLLSHDAFTAHCLGIKDYYQLCADDRVLQFASTNFDASLEQIFPTLLAGADLVMRDKNVWTPQELARVVDDEKLTVVNLPTAYWNQFIQQATRTDSDDAIGVRLLIVGGDLLRTDSLALWKKSSLRDARLLNAYGPTETVITASLFEIAPDRELEKGAVPIGKPAPGRRVYILDKHGNVAPIGVAGELYIGGDLIARGYLKRPDLTAEKFIPDSFSAIAGSRLYRTGDLVRFNYMGDLEFLGRVDDQVKIRGYRIELGEIEAALNQYDGMSECTVVVHEDEDHEKRLVAYYVYQGDQAPGVSALRAFLGARLPDYMIPLAFVALDNMPLMPSGKIDRRALPVPEHLRPNIAAAFVAPRTETEKRLAEIVAEVLKIKQVGVLDNFFELGGHSMLGTQVISQLRDEFQVELPLRALFENPTVEGIARAITEELAAGQDDSELEAMLDELDGMSDDEIQRLLDGE